MVAYDYVLTVSDEFVLIWRGRKGIATWLFIVNRYSPFLSLAVFYIPAYGYEVSLFSACLCTSSRR